ncbi:MAG: hypothetical protein OXF79_20165 [Chloroflexi bacterium]|nr:hypothetical protein [Chloroflexota bacterium]
MRANKFFVGLLLDQLQTADRAWQGANYLVDRYFTATGNFWGEISDTHHATVNSICKKGFEGQPFALGLRVNSFPRQLRAAARKIVVEYDSDVRNVWNDVGKEDVDEIYWRLREFDGIGDALAKMGQFILVRSYGVAGGKESKKYMSVKPDVHLQRVLFRLGICASDTPTSVIENTEMLNLESPADFDWSVWTIGHSFCHASNPDCGSCPLDALCEKNF